MTDTLSREAVTDDIKLDRTRGSFRVTYMAHGKKYVMCRLPGCIPFVMAEKAWRELPIHPRALERKGAQT